MTFQSEEESVSSGRIVELYEITVGTDVFRFTNSERNDVFSTSEFVGAPIDRSQPKVDQDEPGSSLEIQVPTNHPVTQELARAWVNRAPNTGDTRVRLWRHHQDDPANQFQLFWVGYLVSVQYSNQGSVAQLACKSLDNIFTLQGPRKNWGTLCNHQLYGPECTVAINDFRYDRVVTAVNATRTVFTLDSVPSPTVTFVGGELRLFGSAVVASLITGVSGNDVTVQYPIVGIDVGDDVQLFEGCNHTLTHCALFSNVPNFGGSPYTPTVNPFTKGLDAI